MCFKKQIQAFSNFAGRCGKWHKASNCIPQESQVKKICRDMPGLVAKKHNSRGWGRTLLDISAN